MSAEERCRHPAAQWQPDLERMTERVADRLMRGGARSPRLAAELLAFRGARRMSRDDAAQSVGVDEAMLRGIEEGRLLLDEVPLELLEALPPRAWASTADGRRRRGHRGPKT